jgi:hypothetical protein
VEKSRTEFDLWGIEAGGSIYWGIVAGGSDVDPIGIGPNARRQYNPGPYMSPFFSLSPVELLACTTAPTKPACLPEVLRLTPTVVA